MDTQPTLSQALNDLLAALPEMFPGVQVIPLSNIRPNPDNPGAPLTDLEIQDLAQNIAEAGLLNPLKVRPDKANPLARGPQATLDEATSRGQSLGSAGSKGEPAEGQALGVPGQAAEAQNGPGTLAGGVQLHPSNPRLRADGQPWSVGDFNYEILAGENRYRAFDYLKRESIPGFILSPTAKEAVKITHLDNEVRDRGWWAAYQTIEQYIQADPNLTQRQVGVELKIDNEKVYRALRLLPLLNIEARALIARNTDNSNKEIRGISEIATSRLAGLGPGTGLKPGVKAAGAETQKLWPYPPIPPETQDLVRRALQVALDREMTEAGVKSLVGWVKDGNSPETFDSQKTPKRQAKANPSLLNHSPKGDPPTQKILWGTRHQGHQEGLILGNETTALPATAPATPEKQAGEEALSGTGVASSKSPAYSAGSPRNDSGNGKVGTLAWEALAGISVINQIKTKIKKGEKPAWWEAILLTGHTLGRAVIWLAKHAYKLVRPLLKFIGRLFLDALKSIAGFFGQTFYGIAKVVMIVVLLVGGGWLGWDIYKHGIFHPINLIESKIQHLVSRADSSAPKPQVEGQVLSVPISPKQEMGAPKESNVNSPKELTQSNLGSHADSPKESAQPTPVAQPEASAPRPQAEEQGLNVPISHKQEIGASQQVSVASTQTQPNPVTRPVASAKAQVQSTPTAHKDVVGQAVGSVGGDVAVDVAKKLFGL